MSKEEKTSSDYRESLEERQEREQRMFRIRSNITSDIIGQESVYKAITAN